MQLEILLTNWQPLALIQLARDDHLLVDFFLAIDIDLPLPQDWTASSFSISPSMWSTMVSECFIRHYISDLDNDYCSSNTYSSVVYPFLLTSL